MRFYCKWYCATSGVDVLGRRFRFASNRYIVCEIVNIKVCPYQVMISSILFEEIKLMSNIFFLKYFIINYVSNFMSRMFNEKSFNKKFLLTRNI